MARKGEAMPGSWRDAARRVIQRVIAEHPELRSKPDEMKKLIDATYPFGERKYLPYKVWLEERKAALKHCYPLGSGIGVPCPACGAQIGRGCIGIGDGDEVAAALEVAKDAELEGRDNDAERCRALAFHASRINRAGLVLPGIS